jgi:hypothetical protein
LVFIISLLVFAGGLFAVLSMSTPARVDLVQADARARAKASGARIMLTAESLDRTLLDDARELALGVGVGNALDRLQGAAPAASKRKRGAPAVEAEMPLEQAVEQLKDVQETFAEVVDKRWGAVLDKRGRVVLSVGEGYKIGSNLRNTAYIAPAFDGISQLSVATVGKSKQLVALAPTVGRDGTVNGVVIIGTPADASYCTTLAAKSGVSGFALYDGKAPLCTTPGFAAIELPQSEVIKAAALSSGTLLLVDAANVGVLYLKHEQPLPVLDAAVLVADDMRPALSDIAAWQQESALLVVALLIIAWVLFLLAMVIAARPADVIANHLALVHQGGKVPALSERNFSGGFKRIVKNLSTLQDKRDNRSGPALQPISALLAGSPDPAEQDMRFESADTGTIGGASKTEAPLPVKKPESKVPLLPPVKTEEDRFNLPPDTLKNETIKPETKAPETPKVVEPAPALGSLFDEKPALQDEDRTQIQALPPPPPPDEDESPVSALPPLPEALPPVASHPPMSSGIKSVSSDEADSALSDLGTPSGQTPVQTPWDTQTAISPAPTPEQLEEEHWHHVYEEFLKVRAQCGEPTNNLTYDKFVEKLRKSRNQVMEKQNTKTVRFQVYVKDGKAALKAVAAR